MRNAAAAEWILSLVSDNSASTVGDLVEESSSRGALWFWSSVLRTACSHLWRDLSAVPSDMVALAFLGLLLMGLFTVFFVPVTIVLHNWNPPSWEIPLIGLLIDAAASFLAGRKVAGLAAGRELPAAFAVVALSAVFNVLEVCLALLAHGIRHPHFEIEQRSAILCVQALFVMAGATLKRRRALARRQTQTSSPRPGS